MVAFACIYALVALGFMAYSRLSGGPWVDLVDFGLDALFCILWPLALCVLVIEHVCTAEERRRVRRL